MPQTIEQVIQDNQWKSANWLDSTDVNRLMNDGVVSEATTAAEDIMNALDESNVQSTLTMGLVDYDWAEQNFGDASDTQATALEAFFDEANVKTFYGNQWWGIRNINKDLLKATKPNQLVLDRVGKYWGTMWNRVVSATVSGMSDIAAITVGTGTTNFSGQMVIDARGKRGDMGFGELSNMYMSSGTLTDILTKQEAGTIAKELIKETYGATKIVVDGVETQVSNGTPEYRYKGVTKIIVDDSLADGIIALAEKGAFAFVQKNLPEALMYNKDAKAGNGVGKEEWGTKSLYIMHPVGFSFKGVKGTDYASKSGLSLAELQGGGLYDLKVDPKLAPITILKVKMGA